MNERRRRCPWRWGDREFAPGEEGEAHIDVSLRYVGEPVQVPVIVWRGKRDGPTVFVSGAVHGDEINGTGAIRAMIYERPFELTAGTLLFAPVVNTHGFERHERYMPDRRDLNRCFPGSRSGSMASRIARRVFDELVHRSDYGIDLHTAAVRRTNFPNVRADMTNLTLASFARAFGAELILSSRGPRGSLRRAATEFGCPTLCLEAGEVWKVEPGVVEYAVRGVRNCLIALGMVEGEIERPPFAIETDATSWTRSKHAGFLRLHVAPGDVVERGQLLATNISLTGKRLSRLKAVRKGIVLGATTIPVVAPGTAIFNIAYAKHGDMMRADRAISRLDDDHLHARMRSDLARNVRIVKPG